MATEARWGLLSAVLEAVVTVEASRPQASRALKMEAAVVLDKGLRPEA